MKNNSPFGLRNATNILNKIKLKYIKEDHTSNQNLFQNKTFIDEESLELEESHPSTTHKKVRFSPQPPQKGHSQNAVEEFS